MIEGVKKASEARGQKTREDIEKRHQRAEIFDRKVREIRGQADPQPKNEADATTEVGQDQAAEEAARHEHRARG